MAAQKKIIIKVQDQRDSGLQEVKRQAAVTQRTSYHQGKGQGGGEEDTRAREGSRIGRREFIKPYIY